MILRGNEQTQKTLFNLRFSSPVDFKPNCNKPVCTENVSGERVQFDLSVTASPDQSLQGYEGIFAYDPNSNSYQWQILPVNTKGRESRANTDSGDFEDSFQEEGTAVTGSGSFINRYICNSSRQKKCVSVCGRFRDEITKLCRSIVCFYKNKNDNKIALVPRRIVRYS